MSSFRAVLVFSTLVVFAGVGVLVALLPGERAARPVLSPITASVLGQASLPGQTHFDALTTAAGTPLPSVSPPVPATRTPTSTPTPEKPTVALVDGPGELTEGDITTFTWYIGGPTNIIHTTTIYYGTTSVPGAFGDYVTPGDAHYIYQLKDFLQGNYAVPLRFVGSINQLVPGTYYYRAYALIDGNHYWSGERTFAVKQLPKHEINVVNYPATVPSAGNAAFTWDVYGPAATTGFTAIVGGKQSKQGILDPSVDIPKTPYAVLVSDFTSGSSSVPQRFVGNTKIADPGVYYFRALAFINGKNIWSQEYSLTVE